MIYIMFCVLVLKGGGMMTTVTQEFNTAQACMIAVAEVRREAAVKAIDLPVAQCLPKGDKK